jgi:VWFA-related protein
MGDSSMRKVLGVAIGAWTVLGAVAIAQGPAPTAGVVETTRVDVVNVDVLVTDREGRLVHGLRQEDFRLFEDGKPVEVTNFATFGGVTPPPAAGGPAADHLPTPAVVPAAGEEPARPETDTVGREGMLSLVVYVDNANISMSRRNEVLAALQTLLEKAVAGGRTEVMVVSGGHSVRIRQAFTADAGALAASLSALEHEAAEGGATSGAETAMVSRMMDNTSISSGGASGGAGGPQTNDSGVEQVNSLLLQARSAAEAEYERTRGMIKTMTQFVTSLAGVPGRKFVFYVGKGLPMRPGEDLLQKFEAVYGGSGVAPGFSATMETSRFNVTELFRDLTRRANAGSVTIYCVDASGDVDRGATAQQVGMTANPGIQTGSGMGLRQSLDLMSGSTGGRTISSGGGLQSALTQAVEDLGSYYSLGYTPPHGHDGAYHTIKVRVNHDGVAVRAREGYLDWSPDDRMAARSLGGLLFNIGSNPLGATISVKPEARGKGDTYAVTVLVTIPIDNLVLQPQGTAHEGSVSLWFVGLDTDNRVTQAKKQVFPIRIPNEKLLTALGQAAGYTFRLTLHKGQHRVAVSLRDDLGETASTITASFAVGDDAGASGAS